MGGKKKKNQDLQENVYKPKVKRYSIKEKRSNTTTKRNPEIWEKIIDNIPENEFTGNEWGR